MQEKKDSSISVILKGICVGGTMLVPGCSGGSMAMILGGIRQTGFISQLFYEAQEGKPFLSDLVLPGRRPGHDTFCQTHVKPDGTV